MEGLLEEFKKREIEVVWKPLQNCSGVLRFYKGFWFCVINSQRSFTHQRFTLAHELFHFDHHRNLGNLFTDYHFDNWIEREANKGAAEMLMPEGLIRAYSEALRSFSREKEIKILAGVFGVSQKAMEIRFKELRI